MEDLIALRKYFHSETQSVIGSENESYRMWWSTELLRWSSVTMRRECNTRTPSNTCSVPEKRGELQIGWLSKALEENLHVQLPNFNHVLGSTTVYSCNGEWWIVLWGQCIFPKTVVMVMVLTNMQFENYFSYYRFTVFSLQSAHSKDNEFCCLGFVVMAIWHISSGYSIHIILQWTELITFLLFYRQQFLIVIFETANHSIIQIQLRPSGRTAPVRLTKNKNEWNEKQIKYLQN